MKTFAGKTAASADKVRGGYYTPVPVARFLAAWVREAGQKILEVDRHVLIDQLGWSPDVVAQCRSAWVVLRDRRTKRGSRGASAK